LKLENKLQDKRHELSRVQVSCEMHKATVDSMRIYYDYYYLLIYLLFFILGCRQNLASKKQDFIASSKYIAPTPNERYSAPADTDRYHTKPDVNNYTSLWQRKIEESTSMNLYFFLSYAYSLSFCLFPFLC
jgi:hypothetical protein